MRIPLIHNKYSLWLILLIALSIAGFLGYNNAKLLQEKKVLSGELTQVRTEYASTTRLLGDAINTLKRDLQETEGDYEVANIKIEDTLSVLQSVQQNLTQTKNERDELEEDLEVEKEKVGVIGEQIKIITETVNVLEKLSKTDEELLQKYSKVYFLNEHYIPSKLTQIDAQYTYTEGQELLIHGDVWPQLEALVKDAELSGVDLLVLSAYRSFGTQEQLKSAYTIVYGEGANQFSADQGYSEHQLGTTVDLTNSIVGNTFLSFETSKTYPWLLENAHQFGFTQSYPEDNSYYEFEPWHWRYVGIDLAKTLYSDGAQFYDLEQREIDKYLISIFD